MNEDKLVPKRRFKEFENSEAWEQREFSDVIKSHIFGPYLAEPIEFGNYQVVQQGDNPVVGYSDGEPFENFEDVILFGDHTVSLYRPTKPFFVATDGVKILSGDGFDGKYFYSTLERYKPKSQGYKRHLTILKKENVWFTKNKNEQQKIGQFFKDFDNLITLHQRKLNKLKETKLAYLSEMFPREGEKYPKLRFDGFTKAWEQRKLREVASFSKGRGYSKNDLREEGTPIILYGNLYTNYKTVINEVNIFTIDKPNSVYSLGNEVVVPSSGESADDIARASAIANKGIILGGDLNIIHSNSNIDSIFLALLISNGERKIELATKAQGKSVVHLYNKDLEELNLIYPTKEEQTRISNFFSSIDNLITLHQHKLKKLENIKKSYLNEIFV